MSVAGVRFVCDEMLGKLARDLRTLGYDTAYVRDVTDDEVLAIARTQDRWLLSRDRELVARRGDRALWIASRDPPAQLAQVVAELHLAPRSGSFLTRCLECNGILRERPEPGADVPTDVADRTSWRCDGCDKVYWRGSHADDMTRRLGRYLR